MRIHFLLDSGATVSVVHLDVLREEWLLKIEEGPGNAVGADGLLHDIIGQSDSTHLSWKIQGET